MPTHRFALAALLLAPACSSSSDHMVVNGVALHERHSDMLELTDWGAHPVELRSNLGRIEVRGTDGPGSIEVELIEKTPGDAYARFADGRLVVETHSGEPWAIGDILVLAPGPVPGLDASTGMGDVVIEELTVRGGLRLHSGMGDVELRGVVAEGDTSLDTGMGSVVAERLETAGLRAESGMGKVRVVSSTAGDTSLVSGMGAVVAEESSFGVLKAKSGMGDVDLRTSTFTDVQADSGMGKVRLGDVGTGSGPN